MCLRRLLFRLLMFLERWNWGHTYSIWQLVGQWQADSTYCLSTCCCGHCIRSSWVMPVLSLRLMVLVPSWGGTQFGNNTASINTLATLETSSLCCGLHFRGVLMFWNCYLSPHHGKKIHEALLPFVVLSRFSLLDLLRTLSFPASDDTFFDIMWLDKGMGLKYDYSWSQWRYFQVLSLAVGILDLKDQSLPASNQPSGLFLSASASESVNPNK